MPQISFLHARLQHREIPPPPFSTSACPLLTLTPEDAGGGLTVYSPYLKRQECLTV